MALPKQSSDMPADTAGYRPFIRKAGDGMQAAGETGRYTARVTYFANLVLEGEKENLWPDGTLTRQSGGMAIIVPPGLTWFDKTIKAAHNYWVYFTVNENPFWDILPEDYYYGLIREDHTKLLQPSPFEVWGVQLPWELSPAANEIFSTRLPGIIASWTDRSPFAIQRAHLELGLVLCDCMEILSKCTVTTESLIRRRIKNAEQHLIQNLPRGYGVAEMARAVGYSRGRFTEVYLGERKMSPREFVHKARLTQAMRLLLDYRESIKTVACNAGYGSPESFCRAFRAMTGMAPSVWRQTRKV